ncbi:hypothetical protein [Streptomyces sp. NPDC058335]|uniref:hypothetical protein n=1 Tax=Streptomyces sp. NPDC058335 TaxID=3346451 RepID=UPI003668460F
MSMPFRRRKNQDPEPVLPAVTRGKDTDAETTERLAADLQTALADAARWKRHADSYAREAGEAKAALARVRLVKRSPSRSPYNAFANAQDDGWDQALDAVHAALEAPERCTPRTAGPDHPVHELIASLRSSEPHPMPTHLVRRYYAAIHSDCCPRDHRELRPGYTAAANRAALGSPVTGVMTEATSA